MDNKVLEIDRSVQAVWLLDVVVAQKDVGKAGGEEDEGDAVSRDVGHALAQASQDLPVGIVMLGKLAHVDGRPFHLACGGIGMPEELAHLVQVVQVVCFDFGQVE